ncbi:hypothetical protein DFQ01_101535 [Paenibacillus cellulosilyticus]|uniref:Uncharacterized protein n=1 Tax=Paenibacillus cellulosilyticus TaxID=375489 RepID=A0A2V2Z0A9_9BACL|nr:hypothetical protein [Paenibacillus cellulosilyticus]PWW08809.1 hypothetical protein DFQ01_101535 [Paenibacillus cellulosilyticus]QKS48361.1 hypothetical protein HUB94_29310 [Paenibacillus cellulosilyticus]
MWKMFGWVGRAIAVGLIASFLSIWTTGYIVNSYVESLLKQYNMPLDVQPFALSGVWGKLWGADPVSKDNTGIADADSSAHDDDQNSSDTSSENSSNSANGVGDDKGSSTTDESGATTGTGDASSKDASGTSTDDASTSGSSSASGTDEDPVAIDAFGQEEEGAITGVGGGTGPKAEAGATAVTTEELTEAKNQLSDADRDQLFEMLATKLPQEAWQTISTYTEDGLTEGELTNIQQIVAQYLTEEQYKQFMDILKKY